MKVLQTEIPVLSIYLPARTDREVLKPVLNRLFGSDRWPKLLVGGKDAGDFWKVLNNVVHYDPDTIRMFDPMAVFEDEEEMEE